MIFINDFAYDGPGDFLGRCRFGDDGWGLALPLQRSLQPAGSPIYHRLGAATPMVIGSSLLANGKSEMPPAVRLGHGFAPQRGRLEKLRLALAFSKGRGDAGNCDPTVRNIGFVSC